MAVLLDVASLNAEESLPASQTWLKSTSRQSGCELV
jgi:hypothetical protein